MTGRNTMVMDEAARKRSRAAELRAKAERYRAAAETSQRAHVIEMMLKLAQSYEKAAATLEDQLSEGSST